MKKIRNILPFAFIILFCVGQVFSVNAAILDPGITRQHSPIEGGQTDKFIKEAGFTKSANLANTIATLIQAFLGILGIIFLILIIYSGYNWMTAAGNEEKVTKAKQTLTRAVIGLIIIVCAYAITYFVFTNLPGGGGGGADVTQS